MPNGLFYPYQLDEFIWAASWQSQQSGMCTLRRLRPSWASAQSDQSSLCAQWVAKDPNVLHADSEDWSDCADAHADLSLRWAHVPLCWFCHEVAHCSFKQCFSFFILLLIEIPACKKCRPWSDATLCGIWSGSTSFPRINLSLCMTKPTKWPECPAKTQISLGIFPVWSESSLSTWRNFGPLTTYWANAQANQS